MLLALSIIMGLVGYLLVGYAWAMLFIHVLTDGYWEREGSLRTYKTPMGAGTAVFWTIAWPVTMATCLILTAFALIELVFTKDFWTRLYHLKS